MERNFKTKFQLLAAFVGFLCALPAMAGITARPCPSKCNYTQPSQPNRAFGVSPDDEWKIEVEDYFKEKIDNLPSIEQILELKKEVKKLRKQLYEISKKASVKMDDKS